MPAELVLTVLQESSEDLGSVAGLAVTDAILVAAGGMVLASSNARHFEPRWNPELGLRDVVVAGDAWWVCGEAGQLAVSHDRGASWERIPTGTTTCLTGLAWADGLWIVGDEGFAARLIDGVVQRLELGTTTALSSVYAVGDRVAMLGIDGNVLSWRAGVVTTIATGSTRPLNALAVTRVGTWIVIGDGGFVARSPDGSWFSRGDSGTAVDLEAIATLADGRLVIAGDRGQILTSADDGRTWRGIPSPLTAHLWSAERFGGGVVIGGDRGVIVKLAPPDDPTWSDRVNQFGAALPLDGIFARGPMGFIASGIAAYLGTENRDVDTATFAELYGMPMPQEAARLYALGFPGLELPRLDRGNAFERLLADLGGGGLAEAFCGIFRLDRSMCLELYPWDGPRQALQFDPAAGTFPTIVADSLDSQVFLAAIIKAREAGMISHDAYAIGMRKLRSRVTAVGDRDLGFVPLEPKRRDTEFFFHRARWITALLGNRELADVRALFRADFNHVIDPDQLPARYDAFERFIPTALYAMWRAYLFDEPELARYLELARAHAARLVRDAAALIDELRGGRNQVANIPDVAAWLSAFRALDLDPRRAALVTQHTARHQAAVAELELTAPDARAEHAWRWLDDGVAHRALLELLDRTPQGAAQIAALDELRGMRAVERARALPRIAAELSSELEAVLVGSVLRDDPLTDILQRPEPASTPGWSAIDRALEPLYRGQEPMHFGTVAKSGDPIHGISVYPRSEPVPHFHLVTYGFTDLFVKETDDPEVSGFGFELTLRVARSTDEVSAPLWALSFLQSLGRYVFGTGNRFAAGHKMGLNGPICGDVPTQITAVCFTDDPELGEITSELGRARFIQVVGITDDEYRLIQEWSTAGLIEILAQRIPILVTDLTRPSLLDDPEVAAEAMRRVAIDGSSEDLSFGGELAIGVDDGEIRIAVGAAYALGLPRAMRGRILHGRDYRLRGREVVVALQPAAELRYTLADNELVLDITAELAREIEAKLRDGIAGTYRFDAWPALQIVVTPSFVRSADGTSVVEVRGIADPDEAHRLVELENLRLARDDDEDETDPVPDPARVEAALAMTTRGLRLAPADSDLQFTHAMLLLDGDRAGLSACGPELVATMPRFAASVRMNVAARLGARLHPLFADVVDLALADQLESLEEITPELFAEVGQAMTVLAADRLIRLVPRLPDALELLAELAGDAVAANQEDAAVALFDRIVALPIPDDGDERGEHLRALNNACIQAHALKTYDAAVRIANRAQPVAHENPYIYHSAACAYAAVGDYARALDQVRLAVEHGYDHLGKVENDRDLGQLLEWPEFKRLFREWHAREEGN